MQHAACSVARQQIRGGHALHAMPLTPCGARLLHPERRVGCGNARIAHAIDHAAPLDAAGAAMMTVASTAASIAVSVSAVRAAARTAARTASLAAAARIGSIGVWRRLPR